MQHATTAHIALTVDRNRTLVAVLSLRNASKLRNRSLCVVCASVTIQREQ